MTNIQYPAPKSLPQFLKSILIKSPFSHQLYLYKTHGLRFFLYRLICKRHERFSPAQMERYQRRKLRALIRHASKNVPFYRTEMAKRGLTPEDISRPQDLLKLPVISKDLVRARPELFRAADFKRHRPREMQTSGSTGKPFKFYVDQKVVTLCDVLGWRRFNWAGYFFNDPFAVFRQPIGYRRGKVEKHKKYLHDPATKMLELNTLCLDDENLQDAFALMRDFRIKVLITYPSYLFVLTDFVKRKHVDVRLKAVISGAEKLHEQQRQAAEAILGAKVFDFYGMEERLFYAAQCAEGKLHAFFDAGILEILKDGRPCRPGETGEIVCTGLHNRSMPLIRYATGDYGRLKAGSCACGSKMPVIEILGGGNKDLIVTRKGLRGISPSLTFIKDKHLKISQMQIYQETMEEMVLKIVPGPEYRPEDSEHLQKLFYDMLEGEIRIRVELLDKIDREPSGKFRFVASRVYQERGAQNFPA